MSQTITVDEWRIFLSRYKAFIEERSQLRFDDFISRFGHIKTALKTINQLTEELRKKEASSFNLFKILSIERYEVTTHSAILADLLNPQGSHCQKSIFLQNFLNYFKEKFPEKFPSLSRTEIEQNYWFVEKEKVTLFGNLDIVVSCPDKQILVVIENKIDAKEQKNQLLRYNNWMKSQSDYFTTKILIYLTPDGRESLTVHGRTYYCFSYHNDILRWLENSLLEVNSSRIVESIKQYNEIIWEI